MWVNNFLIYFLYKANVVKHVCIGLFTMIKLCSVHVLLQQKLHHANLPPIHDRNLYLAKRWYRRAMQHNCVVQDYIDNNYNECSSVNCTDVDGQTIAHVASMFGSIKCLTYVGQQFPHLLPL